jgi:hypothetical protein
VRSPGSSPGESKGRLSWRPAEDAPMGYRGKLAERQQGAAAAQQRAPRVLLRWLRRFFEIDPPGRVPEAVPGGT